MLSNSLYKIEVKFRKREQIEGVNLSIFKRKTHKQAITIYSRIKNSLQKFCFHRVDEYHVKGLYDHMNTKTSAGIFPVASVAETPG